MGESSKSSSGSPAATTWSQRGVTAAKAGDLAEARRCFVAAIKAEPRDARHRFNLAVVLEGLNRSEEAAVLFSQALRVDPTLQGAARRLCAILERGTSIGATRLDSDGLRAALAFDTVDRELIAAVALDHLTAMAPLRPLIERGRRDGWPAVARRLCLTLTHDALKLPLLHAVLGCSVLVHAELEHLLSAVRKVLLLEAKDTRLGDTALATFAAALLQQSWLNEHVWAESTEESEALARLSTPIDGIASGDPAACRALLVRSLYRPLPPELTPDNLSAVQPTSLRDALVAKLGEDAEIRRRSAAMPTLSSVTGETSELVARMYEASPYPRWTSVSLFPNGAYLQHIQRFFPAGQLAFASQPFEVLIAGCGTGKQVVSAALDYGANARVLGIDISRTSLGYASLMAERMGAKNVTLAFGDLTQVGTFSPPFARRFHVIECGGVLHHMADPFAAWRDLVQCLAPGGIMLVGLYSRTARRNVEVLRAEPEYPGPSADASQLRAYRHLLMQRRGDWPGVELTRTRDFFSASGFRDFILHVCEQTTTLPEIAGFLEDCGLVFRGFVFPPIETLQTKYPDETAPGSLAHWAEWESERPDAFAGMYMLWCTAAS